MTAIPAERYPALAVFAAGRPIDGLVVPVRAPRPSTRTGQLQFNLRPGIADADAVEFYAYGYCAHLAAAVHEVTGWPFGLVEFHDCGLWEANHAGVVAPSGCFIDIYGVKAPGLVAHMTERVKRRPARIRVVSTTKELLAAFGSHGERSDSWWAGELGPLAADVTRYFADRLIEQTTYPLRRPAMDGFADEQWTAEQVARLEATGLTPQEWERITNTRAWDDLAEESYAAGHGGGYVDTAIEQAGLEEE